MGWEANPPGGCVDCGCGTTVISTPCAPCNIPQQDIHLDWTYRYGVGFASTGTASATLSYSTTNPNAAQDSGTTGTGWYSPIQTTSDPTCPLTYAKLSCNAGRVLLQVKRGFLAGSTYNWGVGNAQCGPTGVSVQANLTTAGTNPSTCSPLSYAFNAQSAGAPFGGGVATLA